MKLLIDIPQEFEQHFRQDAFNDSLHRLSADAHLLAGLYEQETALMLSKVLKNAQVADVVEVRHGRLINPNPFGDCSVCGFLIDIRDNFNYCPKCGVKLDGGQDV